MRRTSVLVLTACLAGLVLAVSGAFAFTGGGADDAASPTTAGGVDPAALATAGDLDATVAALQDRLRAQPTDARSWATLGIAYVEQARLTGDATYYPKAAGALRRSLRAQPDDNALALAGKATLSSARHDFAAALRQARAALRIDAYQVGALSIRVDALTELGRYRQALRALEQADRRRPSLQTFARYSYARELRGADRAAVVLLERALSSASTAADRAYLLTLRADLERKNGQLGASDRSLAEALRGDPDNVAAAASQARLAVARGDLARAERQWQSLVARAPLPEYVLQLAELLQATGDGPAARAQYAVLEATAQLARSNGVNTDVEIAAYEADHGSPSRAVRSARAAWSAAPSIAAADVLAWALHRTGRDEPALRYARIATRLGTENALLWIHRGSIEQSLGLSAAATHLRRGLAADPGLSPWQADRARQLLEAARR